MKASLAPPLAILRGRPAALALLALLLAGAASLVSGPFSAALEKEDDIARAQELLSRIRDLSAAGETPAPLWGPDRGALATAFRIRLEALAASRAVVIDGVTVEPDPARPAAPWIAATLRGTTDGLHGLLLALETQPPLIVVETGDIAVAGAADPERDRPTILTASLKVRGFIAAGPTPGGKPKS